MNKKYSPLSEAILCSFGLMIFSCFIHSGFPIRLISFAALMLPAYCFSSNLRSLSDLRKITGQPASLLITQIYVFTGYIIGMLLSIYYRWNLGMSLLPTSIHYFVIVAALIGSIEELVFRGFILEYVKSINTPFSIIFSAVSHTGYKCCLFIVPLAAADIDIGFLAIWTFGAGILFGIMNHFLKSIFPSLIAHAFFDIIVYAEFVKAPWWVW